jgi:hypothetical protein
VILPERNVLPTAASSRKPRRFVERWLVSGIAIVIAAAQVVLSSSADLSPWKGGGFGMFGAIDSPSMRVISADGLDSDGMRYRIDALSGLTASERRSIRSFPRPEALERLAVDLLMSDFVPMHSQYLSIYQRLKADNPSLALEVTQTGVIDKPVYRVGRPEDPRLTDSQIKRFLRVRVHVWRVRFDAPQVSLRAETLLGPIEVARAFH